MSESSGVNFKGLLKDKKLFNLFRKDSELHATEATELIEENNEESLWSLLKTKTILEVGYSHDWGGHFGVYKWGGLFFIFEEYCGCRGPFKSFQKALSDISKQHFTAYEITGTAYTVESSIPLKTTLKIVKNIIYPGESLKINNKTYTRTRKGLTITK
jgi:hypothetical protein